MKRCSLCFALVPEDAEKCPKCGCSILQSDDEQDMPLRNVLQFFSSPIPFYVKAKPPVVVNGELVSFETEWKLFKARLQQNAPSILIWDRDGYLPGKQEAALHLVEKEDLAHILQSLPEKKIRELEKLLRDEWGIQKSEEDESILDVLSSKPLVFQPVPRLRDPSILEKMDWKSYVESLVCPKPGKDPKLITVHRAKLIKPLAMHYAPHSLEIANSNTGKTRFYDTAGIKIDKATRKAVLGFAKSPTEVYPGTINGTELPTAFDQIESQDSYELAKYMLDILETGRALVDAGGVRFVVETKSSFAYLGNPVAKDAKVVEGFKVLLNHICANPAMGRRFGIILFSTKLKTIRGKDKMTLQELEEWKRSFILFRAVEEYAEPKLRKIIRDPKVAEWLHQPIPGYRETIYNATQELDDYNLAAFFESHAEAEHRVRGAALHAAVTNLLDKIVLDKITVDEILEEAEDLLSEYVDINLQSIVDLCSMWDKLRTDQAKAYFENLSDYMKEIVSACIHYKKNNPEAVSVKLSEIPYEPENKKAYPYFSKCIDLLQRRKKISSLNEALENFYGFHLVKTDGDIIVEYFENPKPPDDLPLIGNFVISSFSSFRNFHREGSSQRTLSKESESSSTNGVCKGEEKKDVSVKVTKSRNPRNDEENSVSVKVEKLRNLRNGEKEDSEITVTCGSCEFFHTRKCVMEHPELIQPSATYAATCSNYRPRSDYP